MSKITVSVAAWKQYRAYHLEIVPSLAAAQHIFNHKGYQIKIELPPLPKQKDWRKEDAPLSCYGYKQQKSRKIPKCYVVNQIDAIVETGKTRKISEKAIGCVNTSLFDRRQAESLDKLAYRYEEILDSAFGHWIDVMRWCTSHQRLCQLSHVKQDSHTGTYLLDSVTKKRFYHPGHSFNIDVATPLKKVEWNKAQRILSRGQRVPVWQIYHAEAYERLSIGDMRGYIISLAISLETIIRHLTRDFLKTPINEQYCTLVNNVPISRVIDSWYKIGFTSRAWRNLGEERKEIKKIFVLRNAIMHRGENPNISNQELRKLSGAVKSFIKQGEKSLNRSN